jgi:hypothetical protein
MCSPPAEALQWHYMAKKAMIAVVLLSTIALGLAADGIVGHKVVGTWTLNATKSQFNPGPAPARQTRAYKERAGGIKVTVKTQWAEGRSTTVLIAALYDGKDYPVVGSDDYDAISLHKTSDRVSEATLMHGGTVVANARREISEDGRSMTIIYKTPNEK